MGLIDVVAALVGGLAALVVVASVVFLDADRMAATVRSPAGRLREVGPHLGVLGAVLVINRLFRHLGQELSWMLGWRITGAIYAVEGALVAGVQTVATPWLTTYFSLVYLYGYAFLVVFPVVAYWLHEEPDPLRRTIVAFAANYALGLVIYTLFISYGPRNLLATVEPLLYEAYPQVQLLTSTVNANTNVFPSLHASLSITVLLLAARTRTRYPAWFLVCVPLAASVLFATMYLGIHWAVDVVAGALVAVLSVRIADRYHDLERHRPFGPANLSGLSGLLGPSDRR